MPSIAASSQQRPKMISRGIVTNQDRAQKRKSLHNLIRRLVQVPEVVQPQQQTPCLGQIKPEPASEEDELFYPDISLMEDSLEETTSWTDSDDLSLNLSKNSSAISSSSSSQRKRRPDRIPDRMSQLSEAALSELVIPVTYNSRMARPYPKEQVDSRTPIERERRERNTLAARHSRAKMRALDELLQKEVHSAKKENERLKVAIAASFSYTGALMERLGMPVVMDFMGVWEKAWEGEVNGDGVKEEPLDKELSADESKVEENEE